MVKPGNRVSQLTLVQHKINLWLTAQCLQSALGMQSLNAFLSKEPKTYENNNN